jgi:hypothetical protein
MRGRTDLQLLNTVLNPRPVDTTAKPKVIDPSLIDIRQRLLTKFYFAAFDEDEGEVRVHHI